MIKRFEDLYYESKAYMKVMGELDGLRDRLDVEKDSSSSLLELVGDFWKWAQKAEKLEKEAFERGDTCLNGSEEYEAGRNYRWVLQDLSVIKKLDGHIKEKELLDGYMSFYEEYYK